MTVAAKPWMMFYPQDWRADESLRLCSLAARGLWVEMLALMHRSERYGYLLVKGKAPTDRQLAALTGGGIDEVPGLLVELEEYDVFSRDRSGTIYSRRMIRDEKRSKTNTKNGHKGGNPSLRKQKGNTASDNREDKPPVGGSLKPQSPETIDHKKKDIEKRDHPIPDGWRPEPFGEGSQSRAMVDGWPTDELKRQVERFTAHHRTRGNKFKDWQQAWSTWVLNSRDFAPAKSNGKPAPGSDEAFREHFLADLREREAFEASKAAAGGAR